MSPPDRLGLDPAIAAAYPDYRAVVLYATGLENGPSDRRTRALLQRAAADARDQVAGAAADHEHIAAWRRTFSSFGAKPSRYPSSVEALVARTLKGADPPAINLLVDAYNAVSLAALLPIGGEDWDQLCGDSVLRFATGEETFVAFHGAEEERAHPRSGEVVWADDAGVTCRRWNWRQCKRTRLTESTRNAYFLLESIGGYPERRLSAAADELARHLRELSPRCRIDRDELSAARVA